MFHLFGVKLYIKDHIIPFTCTLMIYFL